MLLSAEFLLDCCVWKFFHTVIIFQKVTNVKMLPVNLTSLKDGLSSLLLPSQKIMFSHNEYVLYILLGLGYL